MGRSAHNRPRDRKASPLLRPGRIDVPLVGLDGDPLFIHTVEGDDDMPAHIRTALTTVNLSIPVADGHLCLGTWQGIYLWEHRTRRHNRVVVVHVLGED